MMFSYFQMQQNHEGF